MAKVKESTTTSVERSAAVMESKVAAALEIVRANVANRKNERSESFVSLYANDAQFQTTPWDMRITFGNIANAPSVIGEGPLVVRELAEVHMSPQFAKRVAMVLLAQLKGYEQTVGTIPLPEEPTED